MYKHKYYIIFLGILLAMGISACSSRNLSESQTSVPNIQEEQREISEQEEQEEEVGISGQQEYASPEAVIKEYLAGLRDNDLERMLNTFDENGCMGQVEMETAYLEEPRVQSTGMASLNFYQSITVKNYEDDVVNDILRQYMILCNMEIDTQSPMSLYEDGDAEKLVKHLRERIEATDFSSMKLLGFVSQEFLINAVGSDRYNQYMDLNADRIGADKVESRACIIELDGNKYVLNFETAEYEGKWLILQLGGYVASMTEIDKSAAGTERLSAEEERLYEKEYEQFMVPAGDLPQAADNAEAEASANWESDGFDTPQEAVKAYLEGIKAGDMERIISTFAVESYVDHYDLQKNLEYTKGYIFMRQSFDLPVVNKLSREFNIRTRKRKITEEIVEQYQILCFINGSYFGNASITDGKGGEDILQNQREMAQALELDTINILGYIPPEDLAETYTSEANREFLKQRAQWCGAEQVAAGMVVFELQGNKYYLCADVIKYNGRWYNWQLGGQLASFLDIDKSFKGTCVLESLEEMELESLIVPMES